MNPHKQPLRLGVGGPVGSGKTALLESLCKALRDEFSLAVVTNDIYTQEDARILTQPGPCRRSASSVSRPGAAPIPPSARTPP